MDSNRKVVIFAVALLSVAAVLYVTRASWMGLLPGAGTTEGGFTVVTKDGVKYKECFVCPMHPQVIKPQMGACPICGMDLVKKLVLLEEAAPAKTGHEGHEMPGGGTMENMTGMAGMAEGEELRRVSLDPRERMVANVRTKTALMKDLATDVFAVGRVAYNEETLKVVAAWFPGRVERMYVHYEGETVSKGQKMMSIYSPELVSAQKEYIIAMDAANRLDTSGFPELSGGSKGMVDAARARMVQWGLTDAQVDAVADTKTPVRTLDVYAPVSGTVTGISTREGAYVMEGTELFRVADLGTVWVNAELYEFEFSRASPGAAVEVTADSFPGEVFKGKVSFIDPVVDSQSRTVRVRAVLPNHGGRLKPEMFVNVRVHSKPRRALVIPASAVLYTGKRNVVWVMVEPNEFEPRDVSLGIRSGDEYEVLSGIVEGDAVVREGGFLLDSEAQLESSAGGGMHQHGMDMEKK